MREITITREDFDAFLPKETELPFEKKLAFYCKDILKYEFPRWRKNVHSGDYVVYDKYYQSTNNPRLLKEYIRIMTALEKQYPLQYHNY